MRTLEELDLERRMKRNDEKNKGPIKGRWGEGFSFLKMAAGSSLIKAIGRDGELLGELDIGPIRNDPATLEGRLADGYLYQIYNDGTIRIDNEHRPPFWAEIAPFP